MWRSSGAALVLALAAGTSAVAATGDAQFVVQVTVPPQVAVVATSPAPQLVLSDADVRRGYKDVSARYLVSANTGRGWLLRLSPRLGLTRHVEVRGMGRPLLLGDEDIEVHQRAAPGRTELTLQYRFVLRDEARPGNYALPVHVSAAPL